jgi:peptidoglycan/xylan/chitin deacetylase (PgdA/CDA1 family)
MDLVNKHPAEMHPSAEYPSRVGLHSHSHENEKDEDESDVIVLGVHIRGTDKDPRIAGRSVGRVTMA